MDIVPARPALHEAPFLRQQFLAADRPAVELDGVAVEMRHRSFRDLIVRRPGVQVIERELPRRIFPRARPAVNRALLRRIARARRLTRPGGTGADKVLRKAGNRARMAPPCPRPPPSRSTPLTTLSGRRSPRTGRRLSGSEARPSPRRERPGSGRLHVDGIRTGERRFSPRPEDRRPQSTRSPAPARAATPAQAREPAARRRPALRLDGDPVVRRRRRRKRRKHRFRNGTRVLGCRAGVRSRGRRRLDGSLRPGGCRFRTGRPRNRDFGSRRLGDRLWRGRRSGSRRLGNLERGSGRLGDRLRLCGSLGFGSRCLGDRLRLAGCRVGNRRCRTLDFGSCRLGDRLGLGRRLHGNRRRGSRLRQPGGRCAGGRGRLGRGLWRGGPDRGPPSRPGRRPAAVPGPEGRAPREAARYPGRAERGPAEPGPAAARNRTRRHRNHGPAQPRPPAAFRAPEGRRGDPPLRVRGAPCASMLGRRRFRRRAAAPRSAVPSAPAPFARRPPGVIARAPERACTPR